MDHPHGVRDVFRGQAAGEKDGLDEFLRLDGQFPEPLTSIRAGASVRVVPLQDELTAGSRTAIYS